MNITMEFRSMGDNLLEVLRICEYHPMYTVYILYIKYSDYGWEHLCSFSHSSTSAKFIIY